MRLRPLLSCFVLLGSLCAQSLEDGPHVLWEGTSARVLQVRVGRLEERRLENPWKLALDGLPPLVLNPAPMEPPRAVLPEPTRITAISDIHGNLPGLKRLLVAQGVLDAQFRWAYGPGHLVVIGDVADRGSAVTETFWLLRSLESQARQAGGCVHVLLGNHDVMLLRGDHRYLHAKYRALEALYPRTVKAMMGPDSELGRWLRSRPSALRLGRFLFVHGGISPALAGSILDLDALNAEVRKQLDAPGKPPILGSEGPLWYRGLLPLSETHRVAASTTAVADMLRACGAAAVIVGHTTLDRVEVFHEGRVFGIDAGLKDGKAGGVWIWENGRTLRGLADGRWEPLVNPPLPRVARTWRPGPFSTPSPEEKSPCHATATAWALQASA